MWNSGGGGFDGGYGGGTDGGFMNTQSQFASPAGQVEKKARRSQNMVPVTLRQILNSGGDTLKIGETEVHMITAVAVIQAVDVTSTKITYTIDDGTAVMDAVQWVEGDQDSQENMTNPLMEMTYCQVFGSARTQAGKKYIMIFRILPVEDPNIITTHILEVIHVPLKLKQIEALQGSGGAMGASRGGMDNSLVGANLGDGSGSTMAPGGFGGAQGFNSQQAMVFQVLQQCQDEHGLNREIIYQRLTGKINQMQVNQVLEFLSSEGHIYTTIDEDHFKTTDG